MCSRIPFYIYLILSKKSKSVYPTVHPLSQVRVRKFQGSIDFYTSNFYFRFRNEFQKCMAGPQKFAFPFLYIYK